MPGGGWRVRFWAIQVRALKEYDCTLTPSGITMHTLRELPGWGLPTPIL